MHAEFRLGEWIVQPSLNTLVRAPDLVRAHDSDKLDHQQPATRKLGHKVMAVLLCLAERPHELVTKDELFTRVWEGSFTTDEALSTVVYELRKALDDDARNPTYIDTIRKSGYRLIAPISELATATQPATATHSVTTKPSADTTPAALPAPPTQGTRFNQRSAGWAFAILATALALAVAGRWFTPQPVPADQTPAPQEAEGIAGEATTRPMQSLAVLPFSTFTEECRQDFFADGLTEMLIADLAYLGPLDVLPGLVTRNLTPPRDLDQVATELAADAVLEGSVLRSGDRLWISIQLVDARAGRILWGGTYERKIGDALDLQQELSREIANQVAMSVAPHVEIVIPPSVERPGVAPR